MSSMASILISYLINALWQAVVICAAAWVVSRAASRIGPRAQHRIWVATLVLVVAAPVFSLHFPSIATAHPSVAGAVAPAGGPAGIYDVRKLPVRAELTLPLWLLEGLSLIYLAVMALFALRTARSLWWTRLLVRESFAAPLDSEQQGIWQQCRRSFGIAPARLLHSRRIRGPVTVGALPPILLLPEGFSAQCAPQDFQAALAHECAHIQRGDFLKNLICELISLPVTFHPAVWLIKSRIAQTREMVCDDLAAGFTADSRSYAESLIRLVTIVSVTQPASPANAIGIFDANILERRIQRMKTRQQYVSRGMRRLLMSAGAVFLLAVATASSSMAWPVGAQSISQPATTVTNVKTAKPPNLSCTYYTPDNHGHDGTCERGAQNRSQFFCRSNSDRTEVQKQIGCQWKVERAEKSQLNK